MASELSDSEYLGMKNFIIERESPLRDRSIKQKPKKMSVRYDEKAYVYEPPKEEKLFETDQEKFIPTPLMRRRYSEMESVSGMHCIFIFRKSLFADALN